MKKRTALSTAPAVVALLLAPLAVSTAARADEGKTPWWVPRLRASEAADTAKAEEPDARNDAATPAPKPVVAPPVAPRAAAQPLPPPAAKPAAPDDAAARPGPMPEPPLMKAIGRLREGAIGREPNARAYLDLIAAGKASPAQANDFAAYVAKRGLPRVALTFQEYALRLDRSDATLWLNLGTIQQTLGQERDAQNSFQKAIDIDPNGALAHYNLGAIYDHRKKYDDAIEQYRIALVLDPSLGDPRTNPQVVNNEHLLAVRLEIYRNQGGSLGLPLKQMQVGTPKTAAKPTGDDDSR
jgi:tetratricopeptide (TPR) repeat protein